MDNNLLQQRYDFVVKALAAAMSALDYCGGGDAWERECNEPAMDFADEVCTALDIHHLDTDLSREALDTHQKELENFLAQQKSSLTPS